MLDIVEHNMQSAYNLIDYVSTLPENRRMVRLGSNQLPGATQDDWKYMWQDPTNIKMLEEGFGKVGQLAKDRDVRISFHPGQFCVLASIPAREFITVIEETELGREIDCLALQKGLTAMVKVPNLRLSIDMSARSIAYQPWMRVLNRFLKQDPSLAKRLILLGVFD